MSRTEDAPPKRRSLSKDNSQTDMEDVRKRSLSERRPTCIAAKGCWLCRNNALDAIILLSVQNSNPFSCSSVYNIAHALIAPKFLSFAFCCFCVLLNISIFHKRGGFGHQISLQHGYRMRDHAIQQNRRPFKHMGASCFQLRQRRDFKTGSQQPGRLACSWGWI